MNVHTVTPRSTVRDGAPKTTTGRADDADMSELARHKDPSLAGARNAAEAAKTKARARRM